MISGSGRGHHCSQHTTAREVGSDLSRVPFTWNVVISMLSKWRVALTSQMSVEEGLLVDIVSVMVSLAVY